jgi:Fur family transcriptional regulator, ferric uptake regulator
MKEVQCAWPEGIKKTKQRGYVMSVLEQAASPLSAAAIYAQIEKGGSLVWLSTVYRILELFVNKGMVIKTTVMDNDMAIYELNRNKHQHYAVCVNCHKVVAMANCPMEEFIPRFADNDFRVLGHKVEMYGYCKECDKKK